MGVFEYQAIARSGKKVKGLIDADSPVAARRKLRDQELFPTKLKESRADGGSTVRDLSADMRRVSTRDLSMMTRQLSVLLRAGMPLVESLTALLDQTSRQRLRKAIFDVRDRVKEGLSLGDGLAAHPRIFSPLYVNMVRAGETSGALEQILTRLADILEREARLRGKVLATLAYPAFMVLFSIGIITFLMLVIVPRITTLLERREQELPKLTEAMVAISHFVGTWWYLLIGGTVALFMAWRYWVSRPDGRLRWDRFKIWVPLFGTLHLKLVCGRFARTLGTMLQSGLTMMTALDVVNSVLQNRYIEAAMEDVKAGVRRGRDLAVPMKDTGVFPPMLVHMIDLGQRSGEIEDALLNVADTYDEDVQLTVDALVSLLEPLIIVVMGLFVSLLVLAILLPILNMSAGIR